VGIKATVDHPGKGLALVVAVTATLLSNVASIRADELVGTTRWVSASRSISICEWISDHTLPLPSCRAAKAGTAIKVIRAAQSNNGIFQGYAVEEPSGARGYITDIDAIYLMDHKAKQVADTAAADCKRRGGVSIGMTADQVRATCWGKPQSVNRTITARGNHEQWVYGSSYVYLEQGVVTSIQTSSR
jgi:hypothetical protein